MRGVSDMSYEGIIKTTHKHQTKAWRKSSAIRSGERENAQKCLKETTAAQMDHKKCIRETAKLKTTLLELANSINDDRRCCCESN